MHYTPEHRLVNGGFLYFGGKSHVSNGQMYLLRSPAECGVDQKSVGRQTGQSSLLEARRLKQTFERPGRAVQKWLWLRKPVPKWVALVSGNMDQDLRFAPPV